MRVVKFSDLAEQGLRAAMQGEPERIERLRLSIAWYVRRGGTPATVPCEIEISAPLRITLIGNNLRVRWQDSTPIVVWSIGGFVPRW